MNWGLKKGFAGALVVACTFLVCLVATTAQEYRGTISGTVTDQTGAAIPSASVEVRNNATNTSVTVATTDQGVYTALDLDPGVYTVSVSANGFKTLVRNNIEVRAGVRLGLDLSLEVGTVSQQVTVSSEAPLLITDSGSGGTVLNTDLVGSLPLLGSNVFSLINSTSGNSHVSAFPDHLSERPFDNGGMDGYSINGGPAGGNNNSFLIDGAPNNNNEGLGFVPPPDAVSQINVMTNAYDAEYGRTGGAITSIALKTGTNAYHGVAWWNFRTNHLNANLWQNNHVGIKSQVTQWSEPGFEVGGPVRLPGYNGQDKTFFSVSYEHFFDTVPSTVSFNVPSASELVGNFCSGAPGNMGIGTVIYDPLSPTTTSGNSVLRTTTIDQGQPTTCASLGEGTGSVIPANRIDPTMLHILSYAQAPTLKLANGTLCTNPRAAGCNNNFQTPYAHGDHYYAVTVRVDENLSATEKFFASYEQGYRTEFVIPPGAPALPGANGLYVNALNLRSNHGATANLTSILSPTLTSTAKVNWLRHEGFGTMWSANGATPSQLGWSNTLTTLFGADNWPGMGFGSSGINYSLFGTGFAATGGASKYPISDNWTAQETLNKVHAAHSLKVGVLMTVTTDNTHAVSQIPTINFSDQFTRLNATGSPDSSGDAIATALMGYPTSITYTPPFRPAWQTRYFGTFVQDDWRVSKKLTLNVGLRWDTQSAPHERYDRAVINFNPGLSSVSGIPNPCSPGAPASAIPCPAADQVATNGGSGNFSGGLVFANPNARSPFANDFQNWGPRFGLAYQVTNKLVFRGGWGRFYDYASAYNFPSNTGFAPTSSVLTTSTNFQTPTLCQGYGGCTPPPSNPEAGLSANGFGFIFPNGLTPVTGSTLGGQTGAGTTVTFMDPSFKPDYVNQFNAGFDYELPGRMVFHIEYNGSRGHNVPVTFPRGVAGKSINQVTASQFTGIGIGLNAKVTNPFAGELPGTTLNGPTTTVQQLLLPFPQFTDVDETNLSFGRLWYNSLQARIEKRASHGLTMQGNFTWSRNIGNISYMNPNFDCFSCLVREPVNIEQPFLLNVVMTYQIPAFNNVENHFVKTALGGWTIAGTAQFQSGSLLASPAAGAALWTGVDPTRPIPGAWTGQTMTRWFNNCVINAAGTALQPSSITAGCPASTPLADAPWRLQPNPFFLNNIPPYFEHNRTQRPPVASLAIFKAFAITESKKFEIRADAYNLTNTPWFGFGDNSAGIQTGVTSPSFGAVNLDQGNDPRTIQLTARFSF